MFERLEERAGRAAEACVADRIEALAEALRDILPREVSVEAGGDGVRVSGPGLGQKVVVDAGLRWTIAGLLK